MSNIYNIYKMKQYVISKVSTVLSGWHELSALWTNEYVTEINTFIGLNIVIMINARR